MSKVDCNKNGVLDVCDIEDDTNLDVNQDGIPDECLLNDCNTNGIEDEAGMNRNSSDCDLNGIPDECELEGSDCDNDGLLDLCEPDCDQNGVPDDCQSFDDCNSDKFPTVASLVMIVIQTEYQTDDKTVTTTS